MPTTPKEIHLWFDHGKSQGCAYMLVVTDEFEYDDYPVYVDAGQDPRRTVLDYDSRSMQKVTEVYDLNADLSSQLIQVRAWSLPAPASTAPRDWSDVT